jgi:hypothetical protein
MARNATKQRKSDQETSDRATPDRRGGPLDGSTSGTIGGGGPETGGPTQRPAPPDTLRVKPENAASGRLEPDPLGAAAVDPDDLGPGPSDVNNVRPIKWSEDE